MSSCSKALWGLFVLPLVGRIFTAISISPSSSSRQYGTRCTFRAGRQLSDKELRYLRTVIVTADVHRGFDCKHTAKSGTPTHLTFRHRSGFSPYTASYEFARTCVFGKQSIPYLSLRPPPKAGEGHLSKLRPAVLPNSLNYLLSLPLVYSTRPPVSVCGTI